MAVPYERTKSLVQTKELLELLANGQDTEVPAWLRARCAELLRAFPTLMDLDALHRSCPELLGPPPPFSRLSGSDDVRGVIDGSRS